MINFNSYFVNRISYLNHAPAISYFVNRTLHFELCASYFVNRTSNFVLNSNHHNYNI